ncbi:Speckle-type POZ protein B, partial [Stegodyphus mimosarum]
MFETEMTQSRNSSIKIPDGDSMVINRMLRFLYSGNLDLFRGNVVQTTNVMELYAAADKYDIPALKKKCTFYLKSNLYVQNLCQVLELADAHSDGDLSNIVFEFINAHAEEVFSTDEWKEIKKNNVWAKLLEKAIFRKNP